jgi:hypothetical protein
VLEPAAHRFVFSRQRLTVRAAGVYRIRTQPDARGALLVRHHRYPVTLRLWVTFHAPGGRPQSRGIDGLHLTSRR